MLRSALLRTNSDTSRFGFTLLELLLVVGIVAVIMGGIIPAFSNYMENQDLTQAQEQLKSDLRSIQNRAITGALSESLVGGNRANYWGVMFFSDGGDPGRYSYFITDANDSCPPLNYTVQGEYTLPGDYVVKSSTLGSGSVGCIFFDFEHGDTTISSQMQISGGYTPVIVGPSDIGATTCKRIELNPVGLIRSGVSEDC